MNERIKEFAIEAGLPTALDYHQKRYEKFAELIVQECIGIVKPVTEYPMESVDIAKEFHRGYWVGCNDSTLRIKEHFGVEE